ncbi:MAG: LamG-like jellyroll fold domain-containing protein [Planctomycetia bacterium]|nr:LamG-like jellyroll fold domain-containing protein [Planctomycetia bacterium]
MRDFLIGLAIVVGSLSTAQGEWTATHSYTFDNYNTEDNTLWNNMTKTYDASILTAGTGTFTTDTSAGTLTLVGSGNTNGAYVKLPDNLFATDQTSATFEVWATVHQFGDFSRIFDIGQNNITNRLFLSTSGDWRKLGDSYTFLQKDSNSAIGDYKLTADTRYLFTVVKTYDADTSTGTLSYYVNGALVGTNKSSPSPLTDLNGTANYIGKSQWSTDHYVNATFSEFNIYNGAAGPTMAKVRAMEGLGTAQTTSSLLATAEKIDALIASAAGYWDGSTNSLIDLSGNRNDLGNTRLTLETGNSSALAGTLNSNGITIRDGKDGVNGYGYNTTVPALYANSGDMTFSTRVKMDTFLTTGATQGNGQTLFFMRNHWSDDIKFGLGTTYGTVDTGLLTLYAKPFDLSATRAYYLYDNGDENYTLELYNEDHVENYFALGKDTWYDLTSTFAKTGDETGLLSLYVYDPTLGEEVASASLAVDFSQLSTGNEFLILESPNNAFGTISGLMDYAGVWNTALTADQVALLSYNVPEPSTVVLFLLGILGLLAMRRKK